MIRNTYRNKELGKISKYKKFFMLKAYNSIVILGLYIYAMFKAIDIANTNGYSGLIYFLIISVLIYFAVVLHDKSFYGLLTPLKSYQQNMLIVLQNKKSRHGLNSLLSSLFLTVIVFVVVSPSIYILGGFAIFTFIVHMLLVDTNDLGKIYKKTQKLDIDISDYRLFDNSLFESLTAAQVFYVHNKREEIVAYIALNNNLTSKQLKERIDQEEYVLISMITKQMERLGK